MSKYEYPRLSRAEIVRVIAEAQIAIVSDHDLLRPKSDFVSDLYTRILIYLDFLLEEDNGQVEFGALEQLENPDHHLDSVRATKLSNRIKETLASLECPKRFTLRDLLVPDADRTEYFISALLNFLLYKGTKMTMLSPVVNELTLIEEQRKEQEDAISEWNAEMAKLNESREMELPFVQEIDAKVKELHQFISSLNNQQATLRVNLRKLKEKIEEKDEKNSSADFAIIQAVQENANLRSKVVQSPEKLLKSLEEKKLVQEEAKNAERLAMQSLHEKTAAAEVHSQVSKKMKKQLSRTQAIQEQANSAKLVDKDYKALKAKLSDDAIMDKSLEAKLLERQVKGEQLVDLKRNSEKESDAKCEEATKQRNGMKVEVESRRRELEATQKKAEAVVAEVDAITARTRAVKESAAAQQQELVSRYKTISNEFVEYMNSIEATLPMDCICGADEMGTSFSTV